MISLLWGICHGNNVVMTVIMTVVRKLWYGFVVGSLLWGVCSGEYVVISLLWGICGGNTVIVTL